jgi:hypothetical protein
MIALGHETREISLLKMDCEGRFSLTDSTTADVYDIDHTFSHRHNDVSRV